MATVNLDEKLKDAAVPEPEIPMVRQTPEGWDCFCTEDGDTWYQKAMNYWHRTGNRPMPHPYWYDEEGVLHSDPRPDPEPVEIPELPEDIKQNGGFYVWETK